MITIKKIIEKYLFLTEEKKSFRMQKGQYHGRGSTMVKGLLLVSHTGFPQCLHNQYVSITQVTQNCKFSILNLATAYFTGTF